MIGLTSALTHLHTLNIIHRDVKLASRMIKGLKHPQSFEKVEA